MDEDLLIDYRIIPKYDDHICINITHNNISENLSRPNSNSDIDSEKVNDDKVKKRTKLSRKASYKLSRSMTQHMTSRQKIKLIMETEFDEMDDSIQGKSNKYCRPQIIDKSNSNNLNKSIDGSNHLNMNNSSVNDCFIADNTIIEEDEFENNLDILTSEEMSTSPKEDGINKFNGSNIKSSTQLSTSMTVNNNKMNTIDIANDLININRHDLFDNNKNKIIKMRSPSELSSISETYDFEDRLVFKLNLKRIESNEDLDDDEIESKSFIVMTKMQQIANEILTTERSYVSKLKLIDKTFQENIVKFNEIHKIFPENIIPQIFSNIKSIYQFHQEFLLPQLEAKLANWSDQSGIGDIMKRFSPFLKLYTEYVNNFDNANNLIAFWSEKSAVFSKYLLQLQRKPECGHLALQHHMLEPVQRVPRYKLLLSDYVKHLSADATDTQSASEALETVKQAAELSNEAIRRNEKLRKLLDLNDAFGGIIDLIVPGRELVMNGPVIRISGRDGSGIERYLFLFTDLVILAQQQSISQHHSYRLKTKLDIDELQIIEQFGVDSSENSFIIRGKERSLEIGVEDVRSKEQWVTAFNKVIEDYHKRKESRIQALGEIITTLKDDIGERAPVWVKDSETTMCMKCAEVFSALRRRHHCRACGIVICKMCSTQRVQLKFDKSGDHHRVCDSCANILASKSGHEASLSPTHVDKATTRSKNSKPSTLKMKANEQCIMNGYMQYSSDGKIWLRRWIAAHNNFVLYWFKAHQDPVASFALPLPGYMIRTIPSCSVEEQEFIFEIYHEKQKESHRFKCDDQALFTKWISIIEKLTKLEMIT